MRRDVDQPGAGTQLPQRVRRRLVAEENARARHRGRHHAGFGCDPWVVVVGHRQDQGAAGGPRRPHRAEMEHAGAGRIGQREVVDQIRLAVPQRLEGNAVERPVRHHDQGSRVEQGPQRRDQLVVELAQMRPRGDQQRLAEGPRRRPRRAGAWRAGTGGSRAGARTRSDELTGRTSIRSRPTTNANTVPRAS